MCATRSVVLSKMTHSIHHISGIIALLILVARAQDPTVGVGESFFLPNNDIYNIIGGLNIFKNLDSSCFKWEKQYITTDDRSTFEDNSAFYSQVASDTSISVQLTGAYTMGATLNAKTNFASSGTTDVRGTSLDVRTYVNATYLDQNCFKTSKSELIDGLVNMLDTLEQVIEDPSFESTWKHYETFLNTYGSHFVIKTNLGAVVRQWTFSKTTSKYTDNQLKIRACVDLAGTTDVGKLNISSCVGVTKEDAESVEHLETSDELDIRGGTDATRERFRKTRSQADLTQLLDEGRQIQSPVDYEFMPIWDVLMMKFYDNSTRYAKAMNLMHYYHGYKDFGCTYMTANGWVTRMFWQSYESTPEIPKYQCILQNQGCHKDDDCHIGGAGTVTYCHGPTCFEYRDPPFGQKAKYIVVRTQGSQHYYEGVNKSCHYKSPFRAYCILNYYRQDIIWDGEGNANLALQRQRAQYRNERPQVEQAEHLKNVHVEL